VVGLAVPGAWGSVASASSASSASSGHIYWANISSNSIGEANLDGTGVNQSFITGANGPSDIVVFGQHLYWANATGGCTESGSCNGSIGEANLDGTGLNENFIPTNTAYGLAIDGQYIYWSNFGTGTIGRANLDGSGVDQSFITGASSPDGVVVDGQNIYWSNNGANTIGEANLDGTGVNQKFIAAPNGPEGMAIDSQYVYWVNHGNGTIGRANLDGTGVDQSFITGAGNFPTRVTVDSQHVYWTTWTMNSVPSPGTIGEANIDGSGVNNNFISSADSPVGVAVSSGSVSGGACTAGPLSPTPTGTVSRLSGADRDATAVAVSEASFPTAGSAGAVVVASDANYPDALAGTPLAVAKRAPLLLTPPSGLSAAVSAEISRVAPKGSTVYVLGGDGALSSTVDSQVQALGDSPRRLAGADREATAVAIAGALGDPKTVLEATGFGFPDALSAGAAAARVGGAVLLTNGTSQASETAGYLGAHPGDTTVAIGGPAATADPTATPLVGADRYATAVMVAGHFFLSPIVVGFASGVTFPDALSGGANIGKAGGPMVLVPPCGALPSSVTGYLGQVKASVSSGKLYGGPGAVGDDVLAELEHSA